jgi:aspartate aminotransferase
MTAFESKLHLSRRTAAVEEAAILRMAQRTRDLKAQGHDVVNLTVGEPDFDTPAHIRQAATTAIEAGYTHYAPIAGFPEVRQAIADKLRSENGLDYAAGEIALANGAKQAITNAAFALLDPGDEVIFLAPYWAAYEGIVRMAGAKPVVLQAGIEDGFKVPVERLAEVLSERTKLLFLNSPCNPSGAVWNRADLQALAETVRQHPRLFVISDDIYEYIVFDGEPVSFAALPGMKARTVTINGFFKAFAMTGWRLGYGAAPEPVARAMSKVQGTFTAGANAFVQQAGIAALKGGRAEVETMRATYRRRRDEAVRRLGAIPQLRLAVPAGPRRLGLGGIEGCGDAAPIRGSQLPAPRRRRHAAGELGASHPRLARRRFPQGRGGAAPPAAHRARRLRGSHPDQPQLATLGQDPR